MKNVQKGFVGVIVAVVIVVVLVGGAVYVYNEKEADTVLQENNKEQITETDTIKTPPQEVKVENKIQVIAKSGWGDCTSAVIKKLPFNYDQMKVNYGGRVYMDRFYVKFDGRAQVELKDGKLVSACGADVQSVNELLIKNGLTITYLDSLKTDFQVLVSKGSDIDKQKVAIEKVYNVQFTERVNLVPMAVPAGMR